MEKRGVCPGENEEPKEKQAQDAGTRPKTGGDLLSKMADAAIKVAKPVTTGPNRAKDGF